MVAYHLIFFPLLLLYIDATTSPPTLPFTDDDVSEYLHTMVPTCSNLTPQDLKIALEESRRQYPGLNLEERVRDAVASLGLR